ncbi:hypothetical protein Tco_1445736 [Tanacetum coccineum]
MMGLLQCLLWISQMHLTLWIDRKVTHWDLFFFALILHPLLHKNKDSCKLLLHAWYLDDRTVIGDSVEVTRVLDVIKVSGPGLGLELNIKKTEIFWPSYNAALAVLITEASQSRQHGMSELARRGLTD